MKIHFYLLITLLISCVHENQAQTRTYHLKEGQSFDIILFNTNPNAKELLNEYLSSVVVVGQEYGYLPQKGFRINEQPLAGNYWPRTMVVGLWDDYDKREAFISEITDRIPDFHAMRREIWSSFFLTYWKVTANQTITISDEKFNVFTAYWGAGATFEESSRDWRQAVEQAGGEVVLWLEEGTSPLGYHYDPEIATITSWESREAFMQFQRKNSPTGLTGLKHINQFVIQ